MFLVANERRDRETTTVEQKVALALRCDDAKMSLVVRRERESFTVFMQKANAQHPPPDRKIGGGARRVPTESQSERAQLPVDPADVRRRRGPRLGAFPGGGEDTGGDGARPTVAALGLRRTRQDGQEATPGGRRLR